MSRTIFEKFQFGRGVAGYENKLMENFLIKYGLYAVFFGSTVEGDAMPIMSGVVAHLGYFNLFLAGAASLGGMFLGDCVWYWAGRKFSDRIGKTRFYQRAMTKAEQFIGKNSLGRQLILSRLIYGTRNVTVLYCGIEKMNFLKFAATDFAVCAVWVSLLVSVGYFVSLSADKLVGDVKNIEFGILILIVCVVGFALLWKFLKSRKHINK